MSNANILENYLLNTSGKQQIVVCKVFLDNNRVMSFIIAKYHPEVACGRRNSTCSCYYVMVIVLPDVPDFDITASS